MQDEYDDIFVMGSEVKPRMSVNNRDINICECTWVTTCIFPKGLYQ